MIKIGLTGSIAMGKSEVARILVQQGLPLFDADMEVHRIYDSPEGATLLRPHVPEAIRDGKVDRILLTKIVMKDIDRLNQLEKIVHLEVARRREQFATSSQLQGHAIIVYDIPLLFEKNMEKSVDVTLVVSAPEAVQRTRALARPSMTPEKLAMIHKRQMPDSEKRQRADYVIENDGTLEQLAERTLKVLQSIKRTYNL